MCLVSSDQRVTTSSQPAIHPSLHPSIQPATQPATNIGPISFDVVALLHLPLKYSLFESTREVNPRFEESPLSPPPLLHTAVFDGFNLT